MKRKLPVYFLVDTSGSMSGEPIQAVNNGIASFFRTLRKDPMAQETASVGIIEYNSSAKVLMPLTELPQVQEPTFTAGGSTSLGAGLDLLAKCIKDEVQRGDKKLETKGDYKPLVFHLTDGYPNDNWEAALDRFDRKSVNFILSCGVSEADRGVLEKVSGNSKYVLELDSATEDDLSKFFEFVTQTVTYATNTVPATGDETIGPDSLPAFEPSEKEDQFF